MNSNRGTLEGLIAIEGIDGSGSTTLARRLGEELSRRGISHSIGCEPTKGEIGRLIRRALSGSVPVEPETMALLFAADRREHLLGRGGIREFLATGGIYVTDRYFFSSLAYQSLDVPWEWVAELNRDYPLPGLLIYLDLPVPDALERLAGRAGRDIYETRELQLRVADAYRMSIDAFRGSGMEVLELDARRPADEILAESLALLTTLSNK